MTPPSPANPRKADESASAVRGRTALIGFVMVLAALLVNAALTYLNLLNLQKNERYVQHTYDVLLDLRALRATIIDAETGQRGFLITGDPKYLEPFRAAESTVWNVWERLEKLTADNPTQQTHCDELKEFLTRRSLIIRQIIAIREQVGFEAASQEVRKGEGKLFMDAIREKLGEMERYEQQLLGVRAAESRVSYWTAVVTALLTALLGIATVIVGYVMVVRDHRRRDKFAAALQAANVVLESRVQERTAGILQANLALLDEIDERRRAEDQARHVAAELERSNRELEQFAGVASHDLQEPLRKIQAFGDRLRLHCNGELGERGNDYLERILGSAARMRRLIDDLLAYSRLATLDQSILPVNLAVVTQEVVDDLEPRLHQTGGKVEVGKLPTIEASPPQMRQLLQNLIGNALKFHRPGVPPVVKITARRLSGQPDDERGLPSQDCEITVVDNGIGFEQIYVDRIFELFQRLHGRDEYEGTGMGLAICKKIVERHNGTITAVSAPGEGTKFVVTLPQSQIKKVAAT